ncbi:glycosyltransferase family 4 protein [Chryseobacterium sp. MP_3.2]|uniref:glycosyltransferase family 4 protein n=1 Tax=Chryseobacterium sp. MP_3.2 TaxID=3071712 RepID=UPI002E0B0359|nr:glycosyltransferase involved in cell wall biosynthesis [Chryseobacterium sp. MP_3.2]
MKILIISQYFFPESFKINDIALGLQEKGHHISILTGIPNYPAGEFYEGYSSKSIDEMWNGMKIYRCKLYPRKKGGVNLFLNYFSFVFFGWLKVRKIEEDFDRILVYEPSPVTVGLPAIIASKKFKAPFYFWVQDLWPESLTAAGNINNPVILKFFNQITKFIYSKAEKVLVQSNGFRNYIFEQGVPHDKIIFYPNTTENFYKPTVRKSEILDKIPQGFIITFAGNFGEAQSLNTLLEAARIIKESNLTDIKWVFLGDGRQKDKIEKFICDNHLEETVYLLGSFPAVVMPDYFACSDVLVASLKKDKIFALTIPSKIQSYLACKKPILVSMDGEGASIINVSGAGFSSAAENAEDLAENVRKIYNLSKEDRLLMGEKALNYFQSEFERETLLNNLIQIMK